MRAAVRTRYGGPEVVRFDDVPEPVPGAGEILVRVHATTVNRTDCAYRSGHPWINRAFCGWPRPRVHILGSEYAGVVVGVAEDVTSYAVGDRVFGFVDGRPGAPRRADRRAHRGLGSHATTVKRTTTRTVRTLDQPLLLPRPSTSCHTLSRVADVTSYAVGTGCSGSWTAGRAPTPS